MHLELQGTNRMSHPFEIIRLPMRKIIHGIYIPFRSGTMMRMLDNTVHDRIAEVHIGRSHVYFRT